MTQLYSKSDFKWFIPTPPKPVFSITVLDERNISINGRLCGKLPQCIQMGTSSDGTKIALMEEVEGFNVPKNGRVKAEELINQIRVLGIQIPAKYLVDKIDDFWIGSLVPPTPVKVTPKKTPRNPRLNGLKTMLPKKEIRQ